MSSIYTRTGTFLKRMLGIKDISLMRKNLHKRVGMLLFHKKYSATELVGLMQQMGMKSGSIVCIHSSMKEFYNFQGTAIELIEAILRAIGEEGTLMMPAFPVTKMTQAPGYIFDLEKDPTGAGYLAETFRKYPGVKRSINVQHSVCAIGKWAEYLTKDHHRSHDCWDENSPYMRLCNLGGLVFNFGLPRSYMGTFHHCVESALQNEHPYWAQFFSLQETYRYYDNNHNVCEYKNFTSNIERRTRKKKVTKHFDDNDWKISQLSNLEVKVFYTKKCFPKMLELGRKGIGVYYVPSPKKYTFQ